MWASHECSKEGKSDFCVAPTAFDDSWRAIHCFAVSIQVATVFRLARGQTDLIQSVEVERFHLRPRPRCFAEKREARLDARVVSEAADRNDTPHLRPTDVRNELLQHHRQRDAVQRIFGSFLSHVCQVVRVLGCGCRGHTVEDRGLLADGAELPGSVVSSFMDFNVH